MIIIKIMLSVLIMISISILPAFAEDTEWSKIFEDQSLLFYGIFFTDDNNGWITSSSGEILHTTDGGVTWEEQFSVGDIIIFDIFFLDANNGWIISYAGEVFRTTDGGETWEKIFSTDLYFFYRMFFLDANNGWVVDEIEIILHTTDGGVTWEEQFSVDDILLFDIFFTDANNGWVVGYQDYYTDTSRGLIFRTTDGGVTWEEIFSTDLYKFNDIFFTDDNNGWAVGQDGLILHTTDGGVTWEDNSIVNENSVFNKIFFNNSKGWIISSDGEIYTTTFGKTDVPDKITIPDDDSDDDSDDNSDNDKDEKKNGGGCSDCIPPTLGLDKNNKRLVDNGFSYNDKDIQVERWHTPFPLINATVGEVNTTTVKVYENMGINNMKYVQFALGVANIGDPISESEVLIEVHLETNGTIEYAGVDNVIIIDKDNLIESNTVVGNASVVKCQESDTESRCIKVDLDYTYREAPLNHVMLVNVADKNGYTENFWFNDGIKVLGKSINQPPTYTLSNKHSSQQTENLTLTLTRTDKVNNIWTDENGIEYYKVSEGQFDRITPHPSYQCKDKPLDEINVPTRKNCNFRALVNIWDK